MACFAMRSAGSEHGDLRHGLPSFVCVVLGGWSAVHVDDDPAADAAVQKVIGNGEGLAQADLAAHRGQQVQVELVGQAVPCCDALVVGLGDVTLLRPNRLTPRRINSRDGGGQIHALCVPACGDGAAALRPGTGIRKGMAADGVDRSRPAFLAERPAGLRQLCPVR